MQQKTTKTGTNNPKVNDLPNDGEQTDVEREGWEADDLGSESAYQGETEMARNMNRGNESKNNADERDLAGSVNSNETPHRREQRKQEIKEGKK